MGAAAQNQMEEKQMKYRKYCFPVLFVVILTAAAGFAYFCGNGTDKNIRQKTEAVYPVFVPENITEMTIAAEGKKPNELRMVIQDGAWIMPDRENAMVSRAAVSELLTSLSRTRPVREIVNPDEETLKSLNLSSNPELSLGGGAGIRLTLKDKDGKTYSFLMGKAHVRLDQSGPSIQGQAVYDGRYIRLDDADGKVHVYLVSRVFKTCIPALPLWLEPLCLTSASSGILALNYQRTDEKGVMRPVWSVVPNMRTRSFELIHPAGSVLAVTELAKRLEMLTVPFSRDLIPAEDAARISFTAALTVSCKNGIIYHLSFAQLPDGRAAVKLEAAGSAQLAKTGSAESAPVNAQINQINHSFKGRVFTVAPELLMQLNQIPAENIAKAGTEKKK